MYGQDNKPNEQSRNSASSDDRRKALVELLLANASIQDALRAAEKLIGSPLALQDLMHEPIGTSPSYPVDDLQDRRQRRLRATESDYLSDMQWTLDTAATGKATIRSWPNIRRQRMYCGCLYGNRLFAFIRVIEGDAGLSHVEPEDVEFAARVLAVMLMLKGHPYTTQRERWPSFLWNLLEGNLQREGLISQPFFADISLFRAYWTDIDDASLYNESTNGKDAWFALAYQSGVAVLVDESRLSPHAVRARIGNDARVGASEPFEDILAFRQGIAQARRALDTSRILDLADTVVLYDALLPIFAICDSAQGNSILTPTCREMLRHDEENGTEFFKTVERYLETGRDATQTSRLLCVHKNTVSYRLDKARSLFGIDLSDPVQATLTHMCILAWKVATTSR